ncbi:HD domain-containing protein [Marinovum sp.]|uniref:HD domain-containing protein n=1 Tax=Marinovum sp. TaxID=2024839 RepID=UPI002B27BBB4|nr:HD domain-containing protein [Marinovum sp.]
MTANPDTPPDRFDRLLGFLQRAEALKDTLRSARTGAGRPESVAAHSWSLCLLVLLLEDELKGVDLLQLLRLCLVHDLGEAISGDVPAIYQAPEDDKSARERADLQELCEGLPADVTVRLLALWEEYDRGETREAALAKGLDKIETMVQHVTGAQVPDFDYSWNLGYGVERTERTKLLRALRGKVDDMTRAKAGETPP